MNRRSRDLLFDLVVLLSIWGALTMAGRFLDTDTPARASALLTSPFWALLLVQLFTGRAYGAGSRVVLRREHPGEYWSRIAILLIITVIIAVSTFRTASRLAVH